ncbi:MAG: IclR family transcriptional regulator [Ornithinimicrobium sp.]
MVEAPRAPEAVATGEGSQSSMRGLVQSVGRAITLLEAVAAGDPNGETVASLAATCDLNRATAWRLLATLEAYALVHVDRATRRYTVGLAVPRLAAADSVVGLTSRAHGVLARLSESTNETADLAVMQRLRLVYVAEVAPASVLTAKWLGRDAPLHATSSGKVMLAWLPAVEVEPLLEQCLTRYTDTTITSVEELRREVHETRTRGYGVSPGELEESLYGVSAPVLDRRGRPFAVVSIWGPRSRVPASRFPELGALAREAALQIAGSPSTQANEMLLDNQGSGAGSPQPWR